MKPIRKYVVSMTVVLSTMAHGGGDSSDGHSHSGEAAPAPIAAMAPRAIAQTEEFELVAVLVGKKLILTLDRFSTNEPVADAQIDIESGVLKAVATQIAPGVYSISGERFVAPGKYPLAISIQAGETADLLTATLDVSSLVAGVEQSHAKSEWLVWSAAGALLLVGGGLIAMRRRQKNRNLRQGFIT